MAPVQNRLVISSTDSTSSIGIEVVFLNLNSPRNVHWRVFSLSETRENFLNIA